jgi:Tol biopolymer transport system component
MKKHYINAETMRRRSNMNSIKRILFTLFASAFGLLIIFSNLSSQQTAGELFERALYTEEAKGDLQKAVELYQEILEQFPENREVAALAQLHIGLCYEKLGLKEAQKAYQKVIDNYPEQTEAIKVAKEKLSILIRAQAIIEKGDKEFKIRQVWAEPDVDTSGAPSPDGLYLSYMDEDTGNLAVREVATGKKRLLTNEATWEDPMEFVARSRISPDGKLVAYSWYNTLSAYDLRLIGVDGTGRRILYSDKDYSVILAEWSSDGQKIAARRYSRKGGTCQIVWVSVADGSVRVLKTMENGQTWQDCVCHSADDRYIAYDRPVEEDSGNYDIYLLTTDGSGEIPLIKHPANDKLLGWAPGRKEILFLSDRTGTWDAFLIKVIDGNPQSSLMRIKSEIGKVIPMAFTQDGSYFFSMHTRWFNSYIAAFDMATGKFQARLSQPIIGSNYYPEWSPDGEYLAYISEKLNPAGPGFFDDTLHIYSLKTRGVREVPCELKRFRNLRWSPDGRSILVTGFDRRNRQEGYSGGLYLIDVEDGKVTTQVEYAPGTVGLGGWQRFISEWSSDGKAIFYVNRGLLMMRELETKKEIQLYSDPNLAGHLAPSPDGQSLVFGLYDIEKEVGSVLVIHISGGEVRELLKFKRLELIYAYVWTPDGKHLLFLRAETEGTGSIQAVSLWRISSEGGDPQKLWQSEKLFRELRVHPDGRRIAFYTIKVDTEVWVMENFLPNIEDKR